MIDRSTPWRPDRRFQAQPMSKWLAPRQLAKTGGRAVLSQLFGKYADRREIMGGSRRYGPEVENGVWRAYPKDLPPDEIWIDYLADTGDGFDPTYAIARLVGAESLSPAGRIDDEAVADLTGPVPDRLQRGRILVMGGDEVYPDASDAEYRNRTTGPFELALPWVEDDNPSLFAIPGNHDWYDGLTSFLRQFCDGRWIGGWKTHQRRSYWAVLLPHRWWIWGIDIAFDTKIDTVQLDYFREISRVDRPRDRFRGPAEPSDAEDDPPWLLPGDNVVLCTAKPSWLHMLDGDEADDDNIRFFIDTIIHPHDRVRNGRVTKEGTGVNVRAVVSGDKHFYARHAGDPAADTGPAPGHRPERLPAQLVTSGGGGAYLSSTRGVHDRLAVRLDRDFEADPTPYHRRRVWPTPEQSVGQVWRLIFWRLPVRNGLLAPLLATFHLLIALTIWGRAASEENAGWADGLDELGIGDTFHALVTSVPTWIVAVLAAFGLSAWAGAKLKGGFWARLLGGAWLGVPHAAMHVVVAALVLFVSGAIVTDGLGWTGNDGVVATIVLIQLISTVTASFVVALYLAVAHSFGRNLNDASVAIQHDGFKNFVRMRLDAQGDLHLFTLGLEDVPKERLEWNDGVPSPLSFDPPACTLIDAVTIPGRPDVDGEGDDP